MFVEADKIEKAKQKIGAARTAEITAELLHLDKFDERNLKACCPFHDENTPSFILNPKTLRWHCFGCSKNVDLIDVFMHCGMTYMEAVQKLFEEAKVEYSFGELGVKTRSGYRYPTPENYGNKEKVYEYMAKRSISKETVDYAGVTEDSHGNVVFNYFDTNDVLCMCKYRPSHKIDKSKGESKNWCQSGADTMPLLYNMNKINTDSPLLITEGEGDCLAAIESGFTNAVSVPFGSQNFQWIEHNLEWLEQFDSIIVCSDNDEPGIKMRKEVVPRLGSWRTKYVEIPKVIHLETEDVDIRVKDLNEILYYQGKAAVMDLIKNAADPGVPSVANISEIQDIDLDEMDGIVTGIHELDAEIMKLFYGTLTVVSGTPGCVSCDTEFFNGERWKKISEYELGDKVLQYNKDGTAELVEPEMYHKYPCEDLYRFHTARGVDQFVSLDHRLIYLDNDNKVCVNTTEEILKMDKESKIGFDGKFITTFDYEGKGIDLTDDEIRLTCAVIADGAFNDDYGEDTYSFKRCRINIKKKCKQERLKMLLDRCGIKYEEHIWNNTDKNYRNYTFIPPVRTKKFPKEWYNCNKHQFEVILSEVPLWDGCYDKYGQPEFFTTDKDNADFIQFAYSSMGIRASIKIDDRRNKKHSTGDYIYKSISYLVRAARKENNICQYNKKSAPHKWPIEKLPSPDGYKYCFTVPSGTMVLRYKNTINVTKNSGKTSLLSQLVCQSLEQSKPVWMFSREMPGWMEKSWLNYIMAGGHHVKTYKDRNGCDFYKVSPSAKEAINRFYDNQWFLYRDDYSNKLDDLLMSMEDSVRKYGAKLLILDNLMTIDLDSNENSELLKQTDCINKLIRFAMRYNVAVVLVAHPRKMQRGEDVGIYDISGTSNIINLAHRTLGLRRISRDNADSDHDVCLTIIKDRMRGKAGKKINLYYDIPTRRFYTNPAEYNYQYSWDSVPREPLEYPHKEEEEVYGAY